MATLNHIYSIYSESYESTLEKYFERGLIFMRSYKTKQMRENVVFTEICRESMD